MISLQDTLQYLGVPMHHKSYMFGDNKHGFGSANHPHDKINNQNTALSFNQFRGAIVSKMLSFCHVYAGDNPADILSNHCSYSNIWRILQPFLFWMGDTIYILDF